MTYVVAEPCKGCKFTDCVEVCPVECFYEGDDILYIHPDECIDCGACVPECPVEAIFAAEDVPDEWTSYTELNATMASQSPHIDAKKDPMPGCHALQS
jgi:ferredoxin